MLLEIKNLKVEAEGTEILHGVDMEINAGEIAGIIDFAAVSRKCARRNPPVFLR